MKSRPPFATVADVALILRQGQARTYSALLAAVERDCEVNREAAARAVDRAFQRGMFGVVDSKLVVDEERVRDLVGGPKRRKQ